MLHLEKGIFHALGQGQAKLTKQEEGSRRPDRKIERERARGREIAPPRDSDAKLAMHFNVRKDMSAHTFLPCAFQNSTNG